MYSLCTNQLLSLPTLFKPELNTVQINFWSVDKTPKAWNTRSFSRARSSTGTPALTDAAEEGWRVKCPVARHPRCPRLNMTIRLLHAALTFLCLSSPLSISWMSHMLQTHTDAHTRFPHQFWSYLQGPINKRKNEFVHPVWLTFLH